MAVDVGSAVGYLDLDITGFLANLRSAQSEADKTTKNMATQIGTNMTSVGRSLTTAGSNLTKKVTVPIVGLGTAVITTSANFESAMSKVQAISGATGKDFEDLTAKAREMGSKTKFSASESAEAFQYMAMAGWDVEDMLNGIEGVMNLAAASGEDLATVSDIVTDAMTAFGLSASGTSKVLKDGVEVEVANTTRFVDALAAASNSSNTNVSMLGESFKYVAPVAGALGYSVEDVAVALGLMANQGIKSSQAGTALRTVLTNMAKPTDQMAAAMDTLGVSLTDDEGNMLSLMDVMKDLRAGFGGGSMDAQEFASSMGDLDAALQSGQMTQEDYESAVYDLCVAMYGAEGAQKAQLAATLAGKTGMAGLLAIVNATDEDFESLTESIYNASGTSQEMADIMQNNLSGQLTILKSMLQELALQFGEVLLPVVRSFVEWLQGIVAKLQELSPEQREQIVKWAAIAAAIGPVLMVIGKLVTSVGGMITTFGKIPAMLTKLKSGFSALSAAIGGVSAPVLAVVAVIAVLIAAFVNLWKNNEEFRNKITAIWDGIKAKFEAFAQGIVDRLNALGFDFENITEVLKAIWDGFCSFLAPIFEGVFQQISNILGAALDIITGIFDVFIGIFTGNWDQAWNGVKEIFGAVWDFIKNTFENWINVFTGLADTVCGWFGTTWDETWNSVKTFFVNIWTSITTWFQNTLNSIKTFFQNIWNGISTFFQNIWNGIVSFVTGVLNSIKSTFESIWNGISSFLSSAWETIKNVVQVGIMFIVELVKAAFNLITLPFRFIWENCKETIMSIWEAIKSAVSTALTAIQTTITNVWTAVQNFFTTVWNAISTFFTNIWNTIKNTVTTVTSAISTTISTVWNTIKTTITTIINAISTTLSTVWNSIKSTITTVVNAISSTISSVWNTIKTTITNVVNAIKTTITTVWNAIKSTISTVVNAISSTVSSVFNSVKSTVSNVFNSIKSTATSVWNGIKTAITTPINAAKSTISSVVNSIKSTISSGFNAAKSTVSSVFNSIKSSISNVMDGAKNAVSNAISNIKSKFNFSWSLPKLKMPHPKISGSFSLNPPSVPHFSIEWYKKAMGDGMILDAATIFGFNSKTGKFMGAGEAGSETIVGTKSLMQMIKSAVNDSNAKVVQAIVGYISSIYGNMKNANEMLSASIYRLVEVSYQFADACGELGYVAYDGFTKVKDRFERYDPTGGGNNTGGGGDTFIFNSPKAIDEIEAAKQMKQTKRDLAEGF